MPHVISTAVPLKSCISYYAFITSRSPPNMVNLMPQGRKLHKKRYSRQSSVSSSAMTEFSTPKNATPPAKYEGIWSRSSGTQPSPMAILTHFKTKKSTRRSTQTRSSVNLEQTTTIFTQTLPLTVLSSHPTPKNRLLRNRSPSHLTIYALRRKKASTSGAFAKSHLHGGMDVLASATAMIFMSALLISLPTSSLTMA